MMFDIDVFGSLVRTGLKGFGIGCLVVGFMLWVTGSYGKLLKFMYGIEDRDEVKKFSFLSVCFALIIGLYWMFRVTKDPVFYNLVGRTYIPIAKFTTLFLTVAIVAIFNFFVDRVQKHRLFALVCVTYGLLFAGIGLAWKFGLPELTGPLFDWIPGRFLGWAYYCGIETLGGILIGAVFWGFVNTTTKTVSAKKGYFLISLGGQVGNLVGPAFNAGYAKIIGNQNMVLIMAGILLLIPVLIELYMMVIPAHLQESDDSGFAKKKQTGMFEGLRLVGTKPFLIGVAIVSTVYEVINTIVDLQFKFLANDVYANEELVTFIAFAAMCSAVISIIFSAGGTRYLLKLIGVKLCLIVYPLSLGLTITLLWLKPGIWTFFFGVLVVKSLAYALNSPIKELLYLPTSKDVKLKAKSIIDSFGGKGAKGVGSLITKNLVSDLPRLINVGSAVSLVIVAFWTLAALATGNKYESLIEKKEFIE